MRSRGLNGALSAACHQERNYPVERRPWPGKEVWQMDIKLTNLSSCAG